MIEPNFKTERHKPTRQEKAEIRERVFARDGHCQLTGYSPCFGALTPHHRRKASQGGEYSVKNLVTLCAHHNDELEADPELAVIGRGLGLVLKAGDTA